MDRAMEKHYATLGASIRLKELESERAAILEAFPELNGATPIVITRTRRPRRATTPVPPRRKRRYHMSDEQKMAVSIRMKRYWRERRRAEKVAAQ